MGVYMRAAVYYNNNDVRLEDVRKPEIGTGELLVKIMASGLCGSDVLEWYRIKKAPIVLGHEVAGVVEEVGPGVEGFKKGDRVVVSHHIPCNKCRYCKMGNHTVCDTLQNTNFDPGGFTEYVRVPAQNVEIGTFPLAEEVSFEDGSFGEPLACVIRGQRLAEFKKDQTVLVMGSGISGLLHILLARANGAAKIIATDINEFKLGKAREYGADFVINGKEDVPALVKVNNEGRGADLVIVCTGALSVFEQSLKCVDKAGTILCFATTEPDERLSVPLNEFWRNSIKIMSSYANSAEDMKEALDLIGSGRINVNQMITHRYPLSESGKAFKMMVDSSDSLKIIINPHE